MHVLTEHWEDTLRRWYPWGRAQVQRQRPIFRRVAGTGSGGQVLGIVKLPVGSLYAGA